MRFKVPMVLLWGPDGVMIYNDAYAGFAGARHPALFGSCVRDGWPEVAAFNDNVLKEVLAGRSLAYRHEELTLFRNGHAEQVWMNLDYSPIENEAAEVLGVLAIVVETTDLVRATERIATEHERLQRLFEQAPTFMAMTIGPSHIFEMANPGYQRLVGSRDILGKPVREALPEVVEQGFLDMLNRAFTSGEAVLGTGLLVFLQRQAGEPQEERYVDFVFQPIRSEAGDVDRIFIQGSDVTDRVLAERHQRLLMRELDHRLKNTLAIVHAIASRTLRDASSTEEASEKLGDRIRALARAQDVLTTPLGEQGDIRAVVASALLPHLDESSDGFHIEGPALKLTPSAATSLSLALHELATNALKHGALSVPGGRVEVLWSIEGGNNESLLRFSWRESGGPRVSRPTRRGFGTRLIERGLALELGGTAHLDYLPEGLTFMLEVDVDKIR
ncbi:PAS domain S-box protein [Cereibacter changlensis]|uniref:histidine kinase n=2 Tax=Cereibacter changlensis TaxID=402884 RepID=A0A4U0YYH7_9RHOB|nr:PAS domain S-box protein [Cereibacter changlensis]